MARSCAICGKTSMGGYNPQSSGMNRVRAHRRYQPNLQPYRLLQGGTMKNVLICSRCRRTLRKTPSSRASAPALRKTAAG
jgi:ribosomal protein L28